MGSLTGERSLNTEHGSTVWTPISNVGRSPLFGVFYCRFLGNVLKKLKVVYNFPVLCYLHGRLTVHLIKNVCTKSWVGSAVEFVSGVECMRATYPTDLDSVVSGARTVPKQLVACRAVQIYDSFQETGLTLELGVKGRCSSKLRLFRGNRSQKQR